MTRPSFKRMAATEQFNPEADLDLAASADAGETAVIENEAAEDVAEINVDADEVEVIGEGIEDTSADVEHLEAIETELETAVSDENHPGLENVAVEAISAVLTMIADNRGFGNSMKTTRKLLARENFDGSVALRRTNTRAALQSVKETLKSIWEQIKQALKTLWTKIKEFWSKHVATLGRLKKAIDGMKKKVQGTKGSPDLSKEIKAPGAMKRAFPGVDKIVPGVFAEFTQRHADAATKANATTETIMKGTNTLLNEKIDRTIEWHKAFGDMKSEVEIGTADKPLLGGFYGTIKPEVNTEGEGDSAKEKVKLTFVKDAAEIEAKESVELEIGTKNQLIEVLDKAQQLVTSTVELSKRSDTASKDFFKNLEAVDKKISEIEGGTEADGDRKNLDGSARNLAKLFRNVGTVVPTINAKIASLNVNLIKLQLQFVSISMSNYKKVGDK